MTSIPEKELLKMTASKYRDACNYVSDYVFESRNENFYSLNKVLYADIRSRYGLRAQMAQSVLKTVVAKYATARSNGHERTRVIFRKPQCDLVRSRDWSYTRGTLSVNTLEGRLKLHYYGDINFSQEGFKYGTAKLFFDHKDRCFLNISVTRTVESPEKISKVVGIDRGIRKPVVSFDGAKTITVQGKTIKSHHAKFLALRKELQMRGTPSARRRLKRIGQRENRWMNDVNHCISKALVMSNPIGTLFVLEDLTGIRGATERVRVKDRYVSVCWSYYDLERKLTYKATLAGQKVIMVDPKYTSQRCPICGSIDKHSRDKSNHFYKCSHCGYQSDDDRIGAMNLYQLGLEYINGNMSPKIQSLPGKPDDGGRCQSSYNVTSHRKMAKGRSCECNSNTCTSGELQAPYPIESN